MTSRNCTSRNSGMLAALRRRNDELETMVELGKALTVTLELNEVLNAVMTSVCQTIKASTWSLLLLDERSQELIFEVVVSPAAERLKGKRLRRRAGDRRLGRCARSGAVAAGCAAGWAFLRRA